MTDTDHYASPELLRSLADQIDEGYKKADAKLTGTFVRVSYVNGAENAPIVKVECCAMGAAYLAGNPLPDNPNQYRSGLIAMHVVESYLNDKFQIDSKYVHVGSANDFGWTIYDFIASKNDDYPYSVPEIAQMLREKADEMEKL